MFRNEEREEIVVVERIYKLMVENISCSKWRKPTFPPSILELRVAKSWNLTEGIMEIDNSNLLARKRT